MKTTGRTLLLWAPRVLGVIVALFIGMFALDGLNDGIGAFLIHAAPAILLLAVVALAWRWEWIGGAAFIALALAYGLATPPRLDWVLIIAGPLLLVGILFLWSWRHHRELHSRG